MIRFSHLFYYEINPYLLLMATWYRPYGLEHTAIMLWYNLYHKKRISQDPTITFNKQSHKIYTNGPLY